jgi:ATP-dependent exoDNAse (exonuclease V) alpha subunit
MEELGFTFDEKEVGKEELTPSQKTSLERFKDWVKGYGKIIRLNGEAGTGKTFIMKQFIKVLDTECITVATIAFTGRAASILYKSTGHPSCTIHKLIYDFTGMADYEYFESSEDEEKAFDEERQLNKVLKCKCLIIDEYSMLSKDMLKDLLELDKMLIFVGDLDQLPPIGEETISDEIFNEMVGYDVPILTLTEPVRQSEYNPILQVARKVRQGMVNLREYTTTSPYNPYQVIVSKDPKLNPKVFGLEENIIITNTNKLRGMLNRKVRKSLKFNGILDKDEKIIITKKNNDERLYNGEIYKVLEVGEIKQNLGFIYCTVTIDKSIGDYERLQKFWVWLDPLENGSYRYVTDQDNPKDKAEQYRLYKSLTQIAYGYAITTYKAQGGQWEGVYYRMDDSWGDKKRSLYTAITRAKNSCIIKIR